MTVLSPRIVTMHVNQPVFIRLIKGNIHISSGMAVSNIQCQSETRLLQ